MVHLPGKIIVHQNTCEEHFLGVNVWLFQSTKLMLLTCLLHWAKLTEMPTLNTSSISPFFIALFIIAYKYLAIVIVRMTLCKLPWFIDRTSAKPFRMLCFHIILILAKWACAWALEAGHPLSHKHTWNFQIKLFIKLNLANWFLINPRRADGSLLE